MHNMRPNLVPNMWPNMMPNYCRFVYSCGRREGIRQFEARVYVLVWRGTSDVPFCSMVQASAACTCDEVSNGVYSIFRWLIRRLILHLIYSSPSKLSTTALDLVLGLFRCHTTMYSTSPPSTISCVLARTSCHV